MRKIILIASIPCRCSAYLAVDVKKRFASMWMQLVFDEVWLYCKYITEHQLFV